MAQIMVSGLTFAYEGSFDNIFENASFTLDTDWRLGLIGRNGKGKTTLLSLLMGRHPYQGSISTRMKFDYFPYKIEGTDRQKCAAELIEQLKPDCEEWRVFNELDKLSLSAEVMYRPFDTLSHGEQTKVMLAILFAGEQDFLLIDEPTNHLDYEARQVVGDYLLTKKGFILVSHDRALLDKCVNHVLVLNRKTIEIQSGNFSSWWENKTRQDHFKQAENEKHLWEINKLKTAARRTALWANKNEATKIGFNPIEEHDRGKGTRAFIGAKTKKMQSRVKSYETRLSREIAEKEGLLVDIEQPYALKLYPQTYHKEVLVRAKEYCFIYDGSDTPALQEIDMGLRRGERVFLQGKNGCGKSTLISSILTHQAGKEPQNGMESGILNVGSGLVISYINQDTSFLRGSIREFCRQKNLDESLFCALLRQLDMERVQLGKRMEDFSEGQKKKVLIAASLMTPAHLYIWDEPLNYIDVFCRMQIEKLLLQYQPTMLLVEHDASFREKIATRVIELE